MTSTTPCADPANDPQDWFISANGRQYSFDDLMTPAEEHGVMRSVLRIAGESPEAHWERVELAIGAARSNRKKAALAKRQAAKSKCFTCHIQSNCLAQALDRVERHGTWGGYFEEEIEEIRAEQARRRRRRGGITTI